MPALGGVNSAETVAKYIQQQTIVLIQQIDAVSASYAACLKGLGALGKQKLAEEEIDRHHLQANSQHTVKERGR